MLLSAAWPKAETPGKVDMLQFWVRRPAGVRVELDMLLPGDWECGGGSTDGAMEAEFCMTGGLGIMALLAGCGIPGGADRLPV